MQIRVGTFHACAWSARLLSLAMIAIVPWFYGGVQWQVQQWIVLCTAVIAILTLIAVLTGSRRLGSCGYMSCFLCGLMVLGLIQLMPLPHWLPVSISAQQFVANTMRLSESAGPDIDNTSAFIFQQPIASTISICPSRSQAALATLAAGTVILWSSSLLFVSRSWALALVVTMAVTAFANAVLGIIQRVAWNNWSLLEFPTSGFYSTFVSRNSAADYFAIGLGAMLVISGSAYRNRKRKRRKEYRVTYPSTSFSGKVRNRMEDIFIDLDSLTVTCLCMIVFLLVSAVATFSRGGAIAIACAGVATLGLTLGAAKNAVRGVTAALVVLVAAVALLMSFDLDDQLLERFDELNKAAYEQQDGRVVVWGLSLSAMSWYWMFGSGLCTYQFAILPYHDGPPAVWFQHAENLYLEVGVEFGLLGCVCVAAGLLFLFRDLVRESLTQREELLMPGAAFASMVMVVHSVVDFGLILPGVFMPLAMLVGAFDGRMRRVDDEHRRRLSRDDDNGVESRDEPDSRPNRTKGKSWKRWLKVAPSLAVFALCLAVQTRGFSDIRANALAERLQSQIDRMEKLASRDLPDIDSVSQLRAEATTLAGLYPRNGEVQMTAGRSELLSLRTYVTSQFHIDEYQPETQWQLSHPYSTLLFLDVKPELESVIKLQETIHDSPIRQEHLRNCTQYFGTALSICPMDSRAAWGAYLCGLQQLSPPDERLAGRILAMICRNNPSMLFKAGLATLAAKRKESTANQAFGLELVRLAIELQIQDAVQSFLVALPYLPAKQKLEVLPKDDIVLLTKIAQSMTAKSIEPDTLKILMAEIQPKLRDAGARDTAGWKSLAWAAEELGDLTLAIDFKRRLLLSGTDTGELRLELAELLHKKGEVAAAEKELEAATRRSPNMETHAKAILERWRSVDQKQ